MIFRRSQNNSSSKNASKQSGTSPSTRNTAPSMRREPELSTSKPAPTAITPPSHPAGMAPPVSPLTMAQARRNPNGPSPAYTRQDQLRKLTVGRDISLNGEITTCDHLVVEGTVTATIKGGQILDIMESGAFSGLVDIDQADIAGRFEGDLTVRSRLILRPTAIVTGTIRYGSLQVDNGACLEGQISPLAQQAQSAPTQTPMHASQQTPMSSAQDNSSQNYTSSNQSSTLQNSYLSSVLDQPGFLKVS